MGWFLIHLPDILDMITPTIKILYIKDPWKIQTFFLNFRWRRQMCPALAPGPGIVIYMVSCPESETGSIGFVD